VLYDEDGKMIDASITELELIQRSSTVSAIRITRARHI